MAECPYCAQDMMTAATCTVAELHRDGDPVMLTPYAPSRRRGTTVLDRCGDCGVRPGGFHHPGCDLQRCPMCRCQFVSCACRFDEDVDLDDLDEFDLGAPRFDDGPIDRYFD